MHLFFLPIHFIFLTKVGVSFSIFIVVPDLKTQGTGWINKLKFTAAVFLINAGFDFVPQKS
jgi:hypothetical protein